MNCYTVRNSQLSAGINLVPGSPHIWLGRTRLWLTDSLLHSDNAANNTLYAADLTFREGGAMLLGLPKPERAHDALILHVCDDDSGCYVKAPWVISESTALDFSGKQLQRVRRFTLIVLHPGEDLYEVFRVPVRYKPQARTYREYIFGAPTLTRMQTFEECVATNRDGMIIPRPYAH